MDKKRLQRRNFLHRKRYNCLRQTDVGKKRRKRVIRRPSAAKTRFNKQKEYIFKVVLKNILLFFYLSSGRISPFVVFYLRLFFVDYFQNKDAALYRLVNADLFFTGNGVGIGFFQIFISVGFAVSVGVF